MVPLCNILPALRLTTSSCVVWPRIRGLKISEYGVFRGEEKIAGRSEEEVYGVFGLPVFPPEMREDRGEIELALEGKLPVIVEPADIKGDLHVHSNWSDGVLSLEEVAEYGKKMGYSYIAICDHSQAAKYALRRALTAWRLRR